MFHERLRADEGERQSFKKQNFYMNSQHIFVSGGGERDRTDDPLLAKQVLSQLSYTPSKLVRCTLVGLVGLEPTTPALSRRCSNQLSYRPRLGSR